MAGGGTWQVPPGISDATVPNPIFNLLPAVTVDEGNNWINIAWGPLTIFNPVTGYTLGNYALGGGSPAINYIPSSANGTTGAYTLAPATDFFGNARKTNNAVDAGAVEFQAPAGVNVLPATLTFPNTPVGTTSAALALTLYNDTAATLTGITVNVTAPSSRATVAQGGAGTCVATLAANTSCTINIVFNAPAVTGTSTGSATLNASVTPTPVATRASATISPNPLLITLATGTITGSGVVTLTTLRLPVELASPSPMSP